MSPFSINHNGYMLGLFNIRQALNQLGETEFGQQRFQVSETRPEMTLFQYLQQGGVSIEIVEGNNQNDFAEYDDASNTLTVFSWHANQFSTPKQQKELLDTLAHELYAHALDDVYQDINGRLPYSYGWASEETLARWIGDRESDAIVGNLDGLAPLQVGLNFLNEQHSVYRYPNASIFTVYEELGIEFPEELRSKPLHPEFFSQEDDSQV